MDLVQPWLVSTIATELGKILEWRDDLENINLPQGDVSGSTFEDDGSNLRIRPVKLGRLLQISKFLDCREPVKATLSDSEQRINVSFATTASRNHEKQTRQRLTQGTLGGVLQLLDFELVATHYGPRPSRLSLFIKEFKILGSGGSGVKGVPRPIEDVGELILLLKKLAEQRKELDHSASQGPSTSESSPKYSMTRSPISKAGTLLDTHAEGVAPTFATQLPRMNSGVVLKSSSAAQDKHSDGMTTVPVAKVKRFSNNLPRAMSNSLDNASDADLLRLYARNPQAHQSLPRASMIMDSSANRSQASADPQAEVRSDSVATSAPDAGDCARPTTKGSLVRTGISNAHSGLSMTTRRGYVPRSPSSTALAPALLSKGLEQAAAPSNRTVMSKSSPHSDPTSSQLNLPKQRQQIGRISIRELKISREQEYLLSRPDSWIPAEPNQRQPVANVPIKILNALNERADRRVGRSRNHVPSQTQATVSSSPPKSNSNALDKDQNSDSNSGTKSDECIPWSPSPIPSLSDSEQLPPDSSANQIDRVVTSAIIHDAHHSSGNTLRDSRSPNRPNSIATRGTSELIGTAQTNVSRLTMSSPDDSSLSDSEVAPLLKCWGCEDMFGELSALSRHIKCYHSSQSSRGTLCHAESTRKDMTPEPPREFKKSVSPPIIVARTQFNGDTDHVHTRIAEGIVDEAFVKAANFTQFTDLEKSPRGVHGHETESTAMKMTILGSSTTAAAIDELSPQESTSSDSELEITIPLTRRASGILQDDLPSNHYPSTEPQYQIPFTQVKRTPCIRGQTLYDHDLDSCKGNHGDSRVPKISLESTGLTALSGSTAPEVFSGTINTTQINGHSICEPVRKPAADATVAVVDLKRKAPALSNPHGQEKRRKFHEYLHTDLIEEEETPHPSAMARYHRRQFFTSRRSSASSPSSPRKVMHLGSKAGDQDILVISPVSSGSQGPGTPTSHMPHSDTTSTNLAVVEAVDGGETDNIDDTSIRTEKLRASSQNNDVSPVDEMDHEASYVVSKKHRPRKPLIASSPMDINASTSSVSYTAPSATSDTKTRMEQWASVELKSSLSDYQHVDKERDCDYQSNDRALNQKLSSKNQENDKMLRSKNVTSPSGFLESTQLDRAPKSGYDTALQALSLQGRPPAPTSLFDRFKKAYSEYVGDAKHFVTLCHKINKLINDLGCLPQFLWDDFIIRQKLQYPEYVQQCVEDAKNPLSYEEYFLTMTDGPMYTKKIVTVQNLGQAFSAGEKMALASGSSSQLHRVVNPNAIEQKEDRLSPREADSPSNIGRRVTIDLTADDQERQSSPRLRNESRPTTLKEKPTRRQSLPWSNQSLRQDGSSKPALDKATRSRHRSRQIPTHVYDSHVAAQHQHSSSNGIRNVGSKLKENEPSSTVSRRRIRVAWDVNAEDVLDPMKNYARRGNNEGSSVIGGKQLHLLADIAEGIDRETGQAMLRAECHSRLRTGKNHMASEVTEEILEEVREKILSKPTDHSRLSPELGESAQARPALWWQDENTPFKSFMKNYYSIRPGRGNSYSKPEDLERAALMQRQEKTQPKYLDFLNWHI